MKPITTKSEWKQFKQDAHKRRMESGHQHGQMLEIMAKERGYRTYASLRAASVREEK